MSNQLPILTAELSLLCVHNDVDAWPASAHDDGPDCWCDPVVCDKLWPTELVVVESKRRSALVQAALERIDEEAT